MGAVGRLGVAACLACVAAAAVDRQARQSCRVSCGWRCELALTASTCCTSVQFTRCCERALSTAGKEDSREFFSAVAYTYSGATTRRRRRTSITPGESEWRHTGCPYQQQRQRRRRALSAARTGDGPAAHTTDPVQRYIRCYRLGSRSCLEKEIMQGTMPGARRRGRPRTAWMDNIKTWTGLSVEESIRMTEGRDKWRKYVHGVANPRIEDG